MVRQVLKQSIGLDVSKDSFSACFSQREIKKEFRILSAESLLAPPKDFASLKNGLPTYAAKVSHCTF
jgi:hypothetical protein